MKKDKEGTPIASENTSRPVASSTRCNMICSNNKPTRHSNTLGTISSKEQNFREKEKKKTVIKKKERRGKSLMEKNRAIERRYSRKEHHTPGQIKTRRILLLLYIYTVQMMKTKEKCIRREERESTTNQHIDTIVLVV